MGTAFGRGFRGRIRINWYRALSSESLVDCTINSGQGWLHTCALQRVDTVGEAADASAGRLERLSDGIVAFERNLSVR